MASLPGMQKKKKNGSLFFFSLFWDVKNILCCVVSESYLLGMYIAR